MSLSINLLPDLRQAKLREQRRRQMVTGIAISTWVVCGALIGLLSAYAGGQKILIATTTQHINEKKAQLEEIPGLVDAITADEHLASLPDLYARRVYLTKFFQAYQEANPKGTIVSSLQVDATNLLTVRGTTTSYAELAKMARAMSLSNVRIGTGAAASNTPYFSDIKIGSAESEERTGVGFSITAKVGSGATSGSN